MLFLIALWLFEKPVNARYEQAVVLGIFVAESDTRISIDMRVRLPDDRIVSARVQHKNLTPPVDATVCLKLAEGSFIVKEYSAQAKLEKCDLAGINNNYYIEN
ncbi:MAG: hypothetical protein GY947_14475 [Rhodobacteraceae bacterium]|nr:hypothetical protein [Paracoccaceae bacterium]